MAISSVETRGWRYTAIPEQLQSRTTNWRVRWEQRCNASSSSVCFSAFSPPRRSGRIGQCRDYHEGLRHADRPGHGHTRDGPIFLRSYDGDDGLSAPTEPALTTAAFIYDNALATIALSACGRDKEARRIATAIAMAVAGGPLYNAYRAGPQTAAPPPNGWYDKQQRRWVEDGYQIGTATGNVAWAALALLTVYNHDGERRVFGRRAKSRPLGDHPCFEQPRHAGFAGGFQRVGNKDISLDWVSTEHNADLAAMFAWLSRKSGPDRWSGQTARALRFVTDQWDGKHFLIGTLPDGHTPNQTVSALDSQTFPLLLQDANPQWNEALTYLERTHGVDGGLDFNDDRDGVWLEGTAQAALAFRVIGKRSKGDRYYPSSPNSSARAATFGQRPCLA